MFLKLFVTALFTVAIHAQHNDMAYFNQQCQGKGVDVSKITNELQRCIVGFMDVSGYDMIKKFCSNTTQLKTCYHAYVDGVSPCFDEAQNSIFKNEIMYQLIDYSCYNNGERIASFASAKGAECLEAKMEPLQRCIIKSLGIVTEEDMLKDLNVEEQCVMTDKIAACTVTSLKSCDPATPGVIAEEMYSFLRKLLPCNQSPFTTPSPVKTHPRWIVHPENPSSNFSVMPLTTNKTMTIINFFNFSGVVNINP